MNRVVLGVVGAVGLVGVAVERRISLAGSAMPADSEVHLSVATRQGPAAVWQIVSDFENQPAWRDDIVSVERVEDVAGKPAYRETDSSGDTRTLVTSRWGVSHSIQRDVVKDGYLLGSWSPPAPGRGMAPASPCRRPATPSPFRRLAKAVLGWGDGLGAAYLRALADHLGDTDNQINLVESPVH